MLKNAATQIKYELILTLLILDNIFQWFTQTINQDKIIFIYLFLNHNLIWLAKLLISNNFYQINWNNNIFSKEYDLK